MLLEGRAVKEELWSDLVSFGGGSQTKASLTVGSRATTLSESR